MSITYSSTYDSPDLRGKEEIRPWDIHDVLRRFWKPGFTVLDVGCGTCAKTAWMLPESGRFIAIDPSPLMRDAASERLGSSSKVQVLDGTSAAIPCDSASVSYLLSIMAPYDLTEYSRVMAPGGLCIMEMVGEFDKLTLKEAFPPDAKGYRGQLQDTLYPARAIELRTGLERHALEIVLFAEGRWNSWFSRPQLEALLLNTNVLRSFSPESPADKQILDRYEAKHRTGDGITLLNHRYLIVGRLP